MALYIRYVHSKKKIKYKTTYFSFTTNPTKN